MENNDTIKKSQLTRRLIMAVLWPSFLMACVSSGLIFSLVDPRELEFAAKSALFSGVGAYTIGFMMFWFLGVIASGLTALLILEFDYIR